MHNNGFKTWVSIEPFPTPNIDDTGIVKLLNRISFVDRIVFGRLHYNKLVKKYPHYQDFYNSTARTVIDFCKVNGIKCHIKIGTFINNKKDFGGDF